MWQDYKLFYPFYGFILLIFTSDCCTHIVVQYTENNTLVYRRYPYIFTTFDIESGYVNGKVHYTSHDGNYALAYCIVGGGWVIQKSSVR